MKNNEKITSWFIGPKGEHAKIVENFLLDIWRDYIYWRRNYFPQDGVAFTLQDLRNIELEIDKFQQTLIDLLSRLKRNFPFYSPRYIAHMLSENTMPSLLGYFSGMIYNPNNVTPEAAPVTVELEIEAVNEIMNMLGYTPPPEPPSMDNEIKITKYENKLRQEFGWGHIVPGGTLANLEALWVASLVKYSVLGIKNICENEDLELIVKLPNGTQEDIKKLDKFRVLNLKPNEYVYMLSKFVLAVKKKFGIETQEATEKASELLKKSDYNLNKGIYKLFSEYSPVIFVSKAAHYSIDKAASVLGIGEDNVIKVDIDEMFRIKIDKLEEQIKNLVLINKKIPIAVIGVAGTTEEGAIDPIHKLMDLRREFEKENNISFWIHIDAAWGGFLRSLLITTPLEEIYILMNKLSRKHAKIDSESIDKFFKSLLSILDYYNATTLKPKVEKQFDNLLKILKKGEYNNFLKKIKKILIRFYGQILEIKEEDLSVTLNNRIELVREYVKDTLEFSYFHQLKKTDQIKIIPYEKKVEVMWGYEDVVSALLAFPYAESITIDPHKLGYVPYPCGMIAYRNDRIRHFIVQKAPYITSTALKSQDVLLHKPPKHWNKESNKVEIDAFAKFIIEGSRPGASATSLWLSVKNIPLNKKGYGLILKYTLLAARELYEWLKRWDIMREKVKKDIPYKFIPLTINAPDTNVVIFAIKLKNAKDLKKMNQLTECVYKFFTIQAELGEEKYSYSQPFFLSKTVFGAKLYPFEVLEKVFKDNFDLKTQRAKNKIIEDYQKDGLFVLRATVMNPYVYFIKEKSGKNLIKEFVEKLDSATRECLSNAALFNS